MDMSELACSGHQVLTTGSDAMASEPALRGLSAITIKRLYSFRNSLSSLANPEPVEGERARDTRER